MNNSSTLRFVLCAILFVWPLASAIGAPISFKDLLARPRQAPSIVEKYGTHAHQFAELWLPAGKGPHRTIVLIHGGCWLAALPGTELMAYMAADLRNRGYAVWSIDYRRIGDEGGGYPGTFLDTAMAIDRLELLSRKHALDLSKVVVVGHSAGGHLASWSAGRHALRVSSKLHSSKWMKVHGVVSLAGINDLKSYRQNGPEACGGPDTIDALTGAKFRVNEDVFADTSPREFLPLRAWQFVVSGELDRIVPPSFGDAYAVAARTHGDDVIAKTIGDAGHFELIDPTSAAWQQIVAKVDQFYK